jgi:hypothetical protein
MKNYSKKKAERIINIFYNNLHNHVYMGKYKEGDYYHLFKCLTCDHKIELFIIEVAPDNYAEEFVKMGYCFEYRHGTNNLFYICYLGNKVIFDKFVNDEICKNMLTCNEVIIKNIIE